MAKEYPPISSIRGRGRRGSTKSRCTIAAGAESEPTFAGAPELQNAQEPKKSDLEFHRTAHSFPKYGSLKGAVRMPQPSSMFLKRLAPQTHVNTLDSRPDCPPQTHFTSTAHAPRGPSPKRRKLNKDPRSRGPEEDIADAEQDARSRTERRGSQTSFAHSMSPGLSEFQSVEASTQLGSGRSHRRSRRPQANRSADTANPLRRNGTLNERKPMESFDELAPVPKPPARQQRTARLVSTAGPRPNASFRDPADEFILRKSALAVKSFPCQGHDKKRSIYDIDDDDELGEEANGRKRVRTSPRASAETSVKPSAPSLSKRGDMNPTKWAKKPGTSTTPNGAHVQAAVCEPNLRYLEGDESTRCILRPTDGPELRFFTKDGSQAEPYHWLKITEKAKTLSYHPEINIVKINQPMDQAFSTTIGGLMVLKFATNADASWVADWAAEKLKIEVIQEMNRDKLLQIYDRLSQKVSLAAGRISARRSSDEAPARLLRTGEESPRERPAIPHPVPTNTRTPLRQQMQVSAQQQTRPLSEDEYPPELLPHSSRSLRTRERIGQVQRAEAPRAPVIHRWSEENPNWAKEWEMPLVFNRATVNKEDIPRLDEGQCLNDNLIGYGLRYLFDKFMTRHQDLHKRVYLHNSFFYEKLKAGRTINYDGVKSWTAKVDLLSYDYIVVPVNEHFHWWVAIICNPGKLDPDLRRTPSKADGLSDAGVENKADKASSDVEITEAAEKRPLKSNGVTSDEPDLVKSDIVDLVSDDKNVSIDLTAGARPKQIRKPRPAGKTYNLEDPRIITLDSLGSSHPQAIRHLKKYLLAEFKDKRNKIITEVPSQLGMKATNIPEQNNLCDCGVYLLGYIQEFVKNPDLFIQTLLQKDPPDWEFKPSDLRKAWRDTINIEHKMYQDRQLAAKQRRSGSSGAKRTPNGSAGPSCRPSRETSEVNNGPNNGAGSKMESSEPTSSTKTSITPANPDLHEVNSSGNQHVADNEHTRSSVPTKSPSQQVQGQAPPAPKSQETLESPEDESVLIIAPADSEDGGAVLPSIEAPEVEEVRRPSKEERDDEPRFIAQLPYSSSRPSTSHDEEDDDRVAEVDPKSFYHRPRSISKRQDAQSSPVGGRQPGRTATATATTRPAMHTSSQFVVDDGNPELGGGVPVVQKAELVRHSDTIDLT